MVSYRRVVVGVWYTLCDVFRLLFMSCCSVCVVCWLLRSCWCWICVVVIYRIVIVVMLLSVYVWYGMYGVCDASRIVCSVGARCMVYGELLMACHIQCGMCVM